MQVENARVMWAFFPVANAEGVEQIVAAQAHKNGGGKYSVFRETEVNDTKQQNLMEAVLLRKKKTTSIAFFLLQACHKRVLERRTQTLFAR